MADRPREAKEQVPDRSTDRTTWTQCLAVQRGHLLPWVPVFMAIGIGVYFAVLTEPSLHLLFWGGIASLAIAVATRWMPENLRPLGWGCVAVIFGFCLAAAHARMSSELVLTWRYYGPIEGRIIAIDRSGSDKPRLTLDHVILSRVAPDRTPAKVRVSLHGDQRWIDPKPGVVVMLTGHLSPPQGPIEPGGFDFRRSAWFQGLGAVGYTRTPVLVVEPATAGTLPVFSWRRAISTHIQDRIAGQSGAFAAAITTGDRSEIPQDILANLRASNLAHLLAISGLHMGLLVGFVFGFLRVGFAMVPFVALRVNAKSYAALVALLSGGSYLALSGAAVATQRAFVMVAVMLIAVMLRRKALTLRAVAIAACVVLIITPEALLGPGFQMSFAATTALVAGFGMIRDRNWRPKSRAFAVPFGLILSSSLAGLATAPFGAAHFNIFSHYGLLANVLSVPIMGTVVMPAAVFAAILAPVGLDWMPLWVMGQGIDAILWVASFVSGLPNAIGRVASPDPMVLPLIALGGVIVILWRLPSRWLGVLPVIAGFGLWAQSERPDILIADTGTLVGVMSDKGRILSREKGTGFIAAGWLENDADAAAQADAFKRGEFSKTSGVLQVTPNIIQVLGKKAASGFDHCKDHSIVVSNQTLNPVGECLILDQIRLRDTGAWAWYANDTDGKWVTVSDRAGDRLWTRPHQKSDQKVRINPTRRP